MKNESQNSMAGLFPAIDDIPEEIRLAHPIFQRHLLINGKLRDWDGPTHLVTSPIFVRNEQDGTPERFVVGRYPLATIKEGTEALEAAVKAFDHGRGEWPAMTASTTSPLK